MVDIDMENFMIFSVFATSLYLVSMALMMNTKDAASALYFKVAPFILGLSTLYTGAAMVGAFG